MGKLARAVPPPRLRKKRRRSMVFRSQVQGLMRSTLTAIGMVAQHSPYRSCGTTQDTTLLLRPQRGPPYWMLLSPLQATVGTWSVTLFLNNGRAGDPP